MFVITERELSHHGVKGQKWGVRKDRSSGKSRLRTAAKIVSPLGYLAVKKGVPVAKKGINKAKAAKKKWDAGEPERIEKKRQKALSVKSSASYTYKQRKHLSDAELRGRINRLNMEKQLRDLSRSEKGSVEFIMLDNGQKAARQALGKYGAKTALAAIGLGGAADFIKPKK